MLSPTFPWPPDIGSRIRIIHLLEELSAAHRVTLVAPAADGMSAPESIPNLCPEMHTVPAISSKVLAAVRSLASWKPYRAAKYCTASYRRRVSQLIRARSFDLIWVNYIETFSCLPQLFRPGVPVVLDQPNDELEMWRGFARRGSRLDRAFAWHNLWKLRRLEKKVLPGLEAVLAVSTLERESLRRRLPGSCPIWTIPNGVDTDYFKPGPDNKTERNREILFCGSLDVSMNADAAEYFAGEIFPRILRSRPEAVFRLVGRNPLRRVRRLSRRDGIVVTGTVPDVRPYYQKAAVAVAPFRLGAGTKLKVLEAMAMGVPVVATPVGAQGIRVADGEHVFIADQPDRFADRVLGLLRDNRLGGEMAFRARKLAESEYDWKRVLKDLKPMLERLREESKGTA